MNNYILEVQSRGVICKVGINDAPLACDHVGEGLYIRRGINEWIMPLKADGDAERRNPTNTLTVFLVWPKEKEFKEGIATVEAKVFVDPGLEMKQPEPLVRFNWPVTGGPERYPFAIQLPFVPGEVPPTRVFAEAESIKELTEPDKLAIVEVVEGLRKILVPMSAPESVYEYTRYKFEDRARATGRDLGKMRKLAETQYGIFRHLEAPVSEPLVVGRAVFTIVANGKLILVTRGPEEEALILRETAGEKGVYAIQVFVARIGGRWQIAR